MAAHALLSASGAARWINCPPSARLTEKMPDKGSSYADEGTVAHKLAEIKLRRRLTPCNSKQRDALAKELEQVKQDQYYNTEMENTIQEYVEQVEERYTEAKARSKHAHQILLEERIALSEWVPEAFGTCDVVIISEGVLEVIDLKYGQGVPVSAEGNPQMRLYGLGAWNEYSYLYDISEVRMTIMQPRRDNVSTEVLPLDELLYWAEKVVRPAAQLAFAGKGEFNPGDHCKWCLAKANCKARADKNMEVLSYQFKDPALLTIEEIGAILFIADQLQSWGKDVKDFAYNQALAGTVIPQWKLVEGKSDRVIKDTKAAKEALLAAEFPLDDIVKPQELMGISALEKRWGKRTIASTLKDLIIKPPGKPALVPETDRRPPLNSAENDFADIEMEELL
ncbi:uncharacterized protein DUF2800 [Anaerospora hongkongensis]|uniref:Uncharacterized protein DUF2800 n=1 Tax=Anaerospora hongkongensis TaxID=244830 RepID=A0A4R1PW01_9FIRM|nr:DUF2800 domain-containing protein [Anaerospora hongkongensis]TCL35622.1 uncharacterized protein DUF2800 [Anaerospora hongkongensis]